MNKKFAGILGAVLLSGSLLAGCGTTVEDVSEDASGDAPKQEEKADKQEEAKNKVYGIGDTVKVDGVEITLTGASFTDPAEYSPSENGKVLTIDVSVVNSSDSEQLIDNTDFSIYDAEGNKMSDYYGYDDMAISDTINKGKKLQGKLYYDVTEQGSYEVIYTPMFSMDNTEVTFEVTPQ